MNKLCLLNTKLFLFTKFIYSFLSLSLSLSKKPYLEPLRVRPIKLECLANGQFFRQLKNIMKGQ
jgi:hypothetical protein